MDKVKPGDTNMDDYKPSGFAWVINNFRVVFNSREIRRGRKKGMFEVYYRKGYNYKKAYVSEVKPYEEKQD